MAWSDAELEGMLLQDLGLMALVCFAGKPWFYRPEATLERTARPSYSSPLFISFGCLRTFPEQRGLLVLGFPSDLVALILLFVLFLVYYCFVFYGHVFTCLPGV
jgi:hypothetical protein